VHKPTPPFKNLQTDLAAHSKGSTPTNSVPGYLQRTMQELSHLQGTAYPEWTSLLALNSLNSSHIWFRISLSFQWSREMRGICCSLFLTFPTFVQCQK